MHNRGREKKIVYTRWYRLVHKDLGNNSILYVEKIVEKGQCMETREYQMNVCILTLFYISMKMLFDTM